MQDIIEEALTNIFGFLQIDPDCEISNPEEPKEIGTYYPSEDILLACVDAMDKYMYAFGEKVGESIFIMEAIDVSDPTNPKKVGSVEMPKKRSYMTEFKKGAVLGWALRVSDSYAYVGSVWKFWVIDVSNPTNPEIVGFHDTYDIRDIKIMGKNIYAADLFLGLQIFEFYGGGGIEKKFSNLPIFKSPNLSISPNPFKSVACIKWLGAGEGPISLEVYNACGRLVRTLTKAQSPEPGAYTTVWDGKDELGREVASGVYFFILEANKKRIIRKAVLVR